MKPAKIVLFSILLVSILGVLTMSGCKKDETVNTPPPTITPITADLFPLVIGRSLTYTGYALAPGTGTPFPDSPKVYNAKWTIVSNSAISLGDTNLTIMSDTTTLRHPTFGVITVARALLIKKNPTSGDFEFLQTLGPFFRAFGIARTDTLRWIAVARPSVGLGGTWVAFDSTYTSGTGSAIRLQIVGFISPTQVNVTDSASVPITWATYKTRTARNIWVGSSQAVTDATTSELYLVANVGPVRVLIAQDTENPGHFRVMKSKNF